MTENNQLDQALIDAYLETEYRVHAEPPFKLRIGVHSTALCELHRQHGGISAFITAFNPYSRQLSETKNLARQEQLRVELLGAGYHFIPGIGQHPSNDWPGEPSFLVISISAEAAKALGKKYEQRAIVWNRADGTPELVLLS